MSPARHMNSSQGNILPFLQLSRRITAQPFNMRFFYNSNLSLFGLLTFLIFLSSSSNCVCIGLQCFKCIPLTWLVQLSKLNRFEVWQNGAVCSDLQQQLFNIRPRTDRSLLLQNVERVSWWKGGQVLQSPAAKADADECPTFSSSVSSLVFLRSAKSAIPSLREFPLSAFSLLDGFLGNFEF